MPEVTEIVDTAKSARRVDALGLASFVALGLPDGMLGTAWPAIHQAFGAPVGDLGLILLASTAGSVTITVLVGYLIRRIGVPPLLAGSALCAAGAAVGFGAAPGLGLLLGLAVVFGVAAGSMDGGLNTAIGLSGRSRLLNLLHGAYGVGTATGPLLVTAAILTGSWRPAYFGLMIIDLIIAGSWILHWRGDRVRASNTERADPPLPGASTARMRRTGVASGTRALRWAFKTRRTRTRTRTRSTAEGSRVQEVTGFRASRAAVAAGIAVFFVYTGLEVGAGQWETTFAREHLHLPASTAGLATFGYWGALTAVRIGLALLPRPIDNRKVVSWGSALAVLAAGLVWWEPDSAVAVVGFVLLGAALAGVFPALIALTPARIGNKRAQHVIAWQVGAAAAGGAGISAILGLLITNAGLAILGPGLTALGVILVGAELLLSRLAPVHPMNPGH